jgi:hypothetical protein
MGKSILRAQTRAVLGRGIVLHASTAVIGGKGYLFTAVSGGGKTTAATVLAKNGFKILGDDVAVICRGSDGVWRVFSCISMTWELGRPRESVPLGEILCLEKGEPGIFRRLCGRYVKYRLLRDRSIMSYGDVDRNERYPLIRSLDEICRLFPLGIVRYSEPETLVRIIEELGR